MSLFGPNPIYNETTRKVIVAFGAIFNDVYIERSSAKGESSRSFKVPLSYADFDKILKTLNKQMSQDETKVAQILPRISFWIKSIRPDDARMTNKNLKHKMIMGDRDVWVRRTPWTISIGMIIVGRYEEDVLKITEQILPEFQPSIGISIKPIDDVEYSEDFTIRLNEVNPTKENENIDTTRMVSHELSFSVPVWFYTGPREGKLIRRVKVGYNVDTPINEDPDYTINYEVTPFDADKDGDWEILISRD